MIDPRLDKTIELTRYEQRAAKVLGQGVDRLEADGAVGVEEELRAPYLAYEEAIQRHARAGRRVLDICCGNGLHSLTAARAGARVTVSDIAANNVILAIARGERSGLKLEGTPADAENLPFPAESFDLVTCAGSLSYVDLTRFLVEIRRVLSTGGAFVCVDSLNHNPIYRFNRYLHYLSGERSRSVISRTPTLRTIQQLWTNFPRRPETEFYGAFSFALPFFRPILGRVRTARMFNRLEPTPKPLQRFSFKFVFSGCKEHG